MLRLALAAVHLVALGIGLGAVWARARTLSGSLDASALRRALAVDTWWGISALLWIGSGLWRLFAATEKPLSYYMGNPLFHAKLGLLALILVLEVWPMMTLIRWRVAGGRGALAPVLVETAARRIARISYLQTGLILVMVVLAVAIARGYGA
jgi:putative membrane protein